MTWMDPHPDTAAEFSNAFYDALDTEQAEADALADRLANHAPPTSLGVNGAVSPPKASDPDRDDQTSPAELACADNFTAAPSPPAGGEDNAPDARPIPARREQPSSTERAA